MSKNVLDSVAESLEYLSLDGAECVFCHVSMKGIGLSLSNANALVDLLIDKVGSRSTLVVPSFAFGGNDEYPLYFGQDMISYDVKLTPCRVNLFGELFRRKKGVYRSLNPVYPVATLGPLSHKILENNQLSEWPFSKNSSFDNMAKFNTYTLGIGVNINTNGFVHVIDDFFIDKFPFELYSANPVLCSILDNKKEIYTDKYYYVSPELRKKIKPIKLHDVMKDQPFYKYINEGVNYYRLELNPFLKFGFSLAEKAFQDGQLPVWHIRT